MLCRFLKVLCTVVGFLEFGLHGLKSMYPDVL